MTPLSAAWLHIARLTLREAVSRKLVLAGTLLSGAFLLLFAVGMVLAADNQGGGVVNAAAASVLASLGLYALHFLAAFLAIVMAIGAVAPEIESGALHALLARPVSRRSFLLGRWLALALLLVAYAVLMGAAILTIARLAVGYQPLSGPRAISLIAVEAVLLLTLGLWGSTRLSTVANGVTVFCLFATAWVGGFIEFVGGVIDDAAMTNVGIAVSLLLPADALWRGASYYSQSPIVLAQSAGGPGIPLFGSAPPAAALLLWTALYMAAAMALAARAFDRRDL